MTKDEAIALRQDQLSGKPVDPFLFAVALNVIRRGTPKKGRIHANGAPKAILDLLRRGPLERGDLLASTPREKRTYSAIKNLAERGLIRCEVRLTEDGLRALGLEGPKL